MELNDIRLNEVMESGTVSLQVGNGPVLILSNPELKELCVLAEVGEPPAEGADEFDRQLLEEDFRLAASGRASLSFDSGSGKYVAIETVPSDGLDDEALREIVTAIAGMRDAWRVRLADVRPENQGLSSSDEGFIRG